MRRVVNMCKCACVGLGGGGGVCMEQLFYVKKNVFDAEKGERKHGGFETLLRTTPEPLHLPPLTPPSPSCLSSLTFSYCPCPPHPLPTSSSSLQFLLSFFTLPFSLFSTTILPLHSFSLFLLLCLFLFFSVFCLSLDLYLPFIILLPSFSLLIPSFSHPLAHSPLLS